MRRMYRDAPSNDVYPRSSDPIVHLTFSGRRGGRFNVMVHPSSCLDRASELASVARPGKVTLLLSEEIPEGDPRRDVVHTTVRHDRDAVRTYRTKRTWDMFEWTAATDGTLTAEYRNRRR